jgi:hypothetical protein
MQLANGAKTDHQGSPLRHHYLPLEGDCKANFDIISAASGVLEETEMREIKLWREVWAEVVVMCIVLWSMGFVTGLAVDATKLTR